MADYVDRKMEIDASRTRQLLGWQPTPRLSLLERLPFLLEHRRSNPLEWYRRNREALEHLQITPSFRTYRLLKKYESTIEQRLEAASLELETRPGTAVQPPAEQRVWDHRVTLRNLIVAVRSRENEPYLNWCGDLAERRLSEHASAEDVVADLRLLGAVMMATLREDPEGGQLGPALHDHIETTLEFGIDRVLEVYEDATVFGRERTS